MLRRKRQLPGFPQAITSYLVIDDRSGFGESGGSKELKACPPFLSQAAEELVRLHSTRILKLPL